MTNESLFSPDFLRRVTFIIEPLQRPRILPDDPEERHLLLEAARYWLERLITLATEEREHLLARALDPALTPQNLAPRHASGEPIPGWDWHTPEGEGKGPPLLDQETIERAAYLVEQLHADAARPFFRELALLEVDRLDLLVSLIQSELARLASL